MGVKSDVSWEQGDETGMSTMDWIASGAHKPLRMQAASHRKRVGDRHARAAWAGFVALSLALSLVGSHAPRAQERVMFRAGISDPVNTVLAWYVARDAGFYGANGLDVDIVNMNGGSRGAAELQAGRLDAMHVGLSSVIRVNRAGGEIRTIGSLSNVIRFTFFSAPGVSTAADLKGGVIGVSTFGSESDSTVTLAMQRLGLSRDDVTLKEYGGGMRRLEAVKSGEIKATPINEPLASLARAQGVHVLIDLVPEQIPWVFSSIVVRRDDIARRRDVLIRFLKGTIEGNYLALADASRAKEVLAKELKIADSRVLEVTYDDFRAQSPANCEISLAGAANILGQFPGGSQTVADYVDTSLLEAVREDGFFGAMERKYRR
ncbi:MAG: ABC transporter substrate-binding protein [Alphaproteobacteria bacterium]|nr:MAG: ABC transporter substrate-binding protein [Alphaproteobacteria bacterium]